MQAISHEAGASVRRLRNNSNASPISFAIPPGPGWKVEVVTPIQVQLKAESDGFVATAPLAPFRVRRETHREALLAFQEHLEWAFIDLSAADDEKLASNDRTLLGKLLEYLRLPGEGCAPLGLPDRRAFLAYPEEERRLVLDRHARLFPPATEESLDA